MKTLKAVAVAASFFVLAVAGVGSAYAASIGAFGSIPVACPDIVPYCPSGGHAVLESDGCTRTVCNSTPISSSAPTLTSVSPSQGTAPITLTIYGSNLTGATVVDWYNTNGQLSTWGAPQSISSDGTSLTYSLDNVANGMLSAGTYQIKVATPNGTSNGASFTFTPAQTQQVTVSPTLLSFTATQGSNPPLQTITVNNCPDSSCGYYRLYSSNYQGGEWLSAGGYYGSGASKTLNVQVSSASLPAGTYTGSIVITEGTQSVATVPVTLTVSPGQSITVASPNGGEMWQQGQTYQVTWQRNNFNDAVAINLIDYTPGSRYGMEYGITNGLNVVTAPGQTSFSWTIPTSIPTGNYYKVVIGSGAINGFSSNYFIIIAPPSVTSPVATFTSFSANPTSIASGQMTTLSWSGTGISQVNMTVTCPSGMSSPDGHGGDACGRTSEAPSGTGNTQLLLNNTTASSQQVTITATAYDTNNTIIGTRTAYVTVAQASTNAPTLTITSPSAGMEVPAGSNLTINYSTSGSFSTPGGVYFVYLKEKPDQLLGNNSVSNTYDPLVFRASSLPYPLTVTLPTVAEGWSGPAYLEIDYTDNSANVIASATSGEFTITAASSGTGSPSSGTQTGSAAPTVSSMAPTTASPGSTINIAGSGYDNTTYISIDNSAWVLNPSVYALGTTLSFVLPSNITAGTHSVQVGNKGSAYSEVSAGTIMVTAQSASGSGLSNQALQQQLSQLITLLLQLLQQAAVKGLLTTSQLNSALGTISR